MKTGGQNAVPDVTAEKLALLQSLVMPHSLVPREWGRAHSPIATRLRFLGKLGFLRGYPPWWRTALQAAEDVLL